MRTLVTGAAGYLGSALTRALEREAAEGSDDVELLLTDRSDPGRISTAAGPSQSTTAPGPSRSVTSPDGPVFVAGDIGAPQLLDQLFAEPVDTVFHLAGIVSGAAEADYELGKKVNLDATIALLERCRQQAARGGPVARVVYASSIAVFGTPLPPRIDDATAPAPTLSYGTHKRACELLIDDCSRRGFIDGRALRLSGVVVRPPLANGALSGFNSDLIREPLAGRRYVCPVSPDATIWITSLPHAIGNLLRLARVDAASIGPQRAMTTPSLALSVAHIVDALNRVDPDAAQRIAFEPQPAIEAQFGRWPLACAFDKGRALGLTTDASIDAVIRGHLENR